MLAMHGFQRVPLVGVRARFLVASRRPSSWTLCRFAENTCRGGLSVPSLLHTCLDMSSFRVDWLHAADQGVAPVFMGGLFHLIITDAYYGQNEEARVAWLWRQIQGFYDREGTADRLFSLTKTMIKPKKGAIELAGSGSQIRALVPFCLQLVNSMEPPLSPECWMARAAMRHLANCYSFLSSDVEPRVDTLLDNALPCTPQSGI